MITVDKFITELHNLKVLHMDKILGCTADEIREIKLAQDVTQLPPLYEDFLLKMGKKAGKFQIGIDFFYPALLDLKKETLLSLEERSEIIPRDAFVFSMQQGYFIMFFRTNELDPPIYSLNLDIENAKPDKGLPFSHIFEAFVKQYRDVAKYL
jgi:hypothetical protein